ncbi:hypothetical protein C4E24_08195, partial [ANME-1 cluster archaeon AG-394-G21]|nr:hypothetical protein [ANME-1 cluster archaeon AG-394-G21]
RHRWLTASIMVCPLIHQLLDNGSKRISVKMCHIILWYTFLFFYDMRKMSLKAVKSLVNKQK